MERKIRPCSPIFFAVSGSVLESLNKNGKETGSKKKVPKNGRSVLMNSRLAVLNVRKVDITIYKKIGDWTVMFEY